MSVISPSRPAAVGGGADVAAPPREAPLPGRTTLSDRALRTVSREVAATAFGVPRDRVTLQLASAGGGLALRVEAPLPIVDLEDSEAVRAGGTVLDRVRAIQQTLQTRVSALTGRTVTRVDVIVTGAVIAERRRVK
ncbi:NTP pyrophosphohydrolase [Microbacterium sp. P04]|uniref:NTP pyrophosphohydrolase n=1 Tax=Microbacterium sp. P04 TaxID=3366947 RepID=UPI003745CF36